MADISTEIQAIQEAVYGEEVRGAIVDALTAMNGQDEVARGWAIGPNGTGSQPTNFNNAQYWAEQAAAAYPVDDTVAVSTKAPDAKIVGGIIKNGLSTAFKVKNATYPGTLSKNLAIDAATGSSYSKNGRCINPGYLNVQYENYCWIDALSIGTGYKIRIHGYKISGSHGAAGDYISSTGWIPAGFIATVPQEYECIRLEIARDPETTVAMTDEEIESIKAILVEYEANEDQHAFNVANSAERISGQLPLIFRWGFYSTSSGTYYNSRMRSCTREYIPATPGETLYYVAKTGSPGWYQVCYEYGADKSFIAANYMSSNATSVTLSDSTYFVRFGVYYSSSDYGAISPEDAHTKAIVYRGEGSASESIKTKSAALGLHIVAENQGVLNCIKRARQLSDIEWSPATDIVRSSIIDTDIIPTTNTHWWFTDLFKAGKTYKGTPYSSRNMVGTNVGLTTFFTAAIRSDVSKMRESAIQGEYNASVYGDVCVGLVNYALGIPVVNIDNWASIPGLSVVGTVANTVNSLKLCDVLYSYYHVALISDIIRDENGNVTHVEVTESTHHGLQDASIVGSPYGGISRRKLWPKSDYLHYFQQFSVYRYNNLARIKYLQNKFVTLAGESDMGGNRNLPLMPYRGDYCWLSASQLTLQIQVLASGYTSMVVAKDGATLNTYTISGSSVTVTLDGEGMYTAWLTDDSDHASVACHWYVNQAIEATKSADSSAGTATFTYSRSRDVPPTAIRVGGVTQGYSDVHPIYDVTKTESGGTYTYTFTTPVRNTSFDAVSIYSDCGEYGVLSNEISFV